MLRYRLIFGALLVVGSVGVFWLDELLTAVALEGVWRSLFAGRATLPPGLVLLGLSCVLIPLAAGELSRIFAARGIPSRPWVLAVAALATAVALYVAPAGAGAETGAVVVGSVLLGCLLLGLIWHSRHTTVEDAVAAAGAVVLTAVYLGLSAGFYLALRHSHASWMVLGVILVTKSCDVGAYFTGRALGRHKLIPWLSPGKTWEGLVGGTALAVGLAVGLAAITQQTDWVTVQRVVDGEPERIVQRYHLGWAALLGALLAVVGHAGDLIMSLFKRDAGLKDSGRMIPGMGGILDVLDSTMLAGVVAYWVLMLAEVRPG